MNDLSLHILDLAQNSLTAGATDILVCIITSSNRQFLVLRDNGSGVGEDADKLVDPFTTSRTTRKVGLGLALMEQVTRMCDGWIKVRPLKPKGTVVVCCMAADHWDLPPMGNLAKSALALIALNPHCRFRFMVGSKESRVGIDSRSYIGYSYSNLKDQLLLEFERLGGN